LWSIAIINTNQSASNLLSMVPMFLVGLLWVLVWEGRQQDAGEENHLD
jgi:hypothetical protein